MGLKVSGIKGLKRRIKNAANQSPRFAENELINGGEEIKQLSKKFAPVDEGNLEDAHKTSHDSGGIRGGLRVLVYIDKDVAAKGGKYVGDYAAFTHEGNYKLGDRSKEKASRLGVTVGRKYLQRALDELNDEIRGRVESAVKKGVGI